MPAGLPLDGSGDVVSTIVLGNTRLSYRLYYTYGPNPGWLVDFSDAEGNEVATGIRLCNGSTNMMKGYADFFKDQELLCITDGTNEAERGPDAPDTTLFVNYYGVGETSGLSVGDAMENLEETYEVLTGPYKD